MESLTWADYYRLGQAFHRRRETETQAAWERTRWQTWQLINIQLQKADRLAGPEDLLRLPADAPKVAAAATPPRPPETKEEKLARARRLDPDKFSQSPCPPEF